MMACSSAANTSSTRLELTPSADWFAVVVWHYGIAGVMVIPMEIFLVARGRRAAQRQEDADRAH